MKSTNSDEKDKQTAIVNQMFNARVKFVFVNAADVATMRVSRSEAARVLIDNMCVVKGGNVRYIQIKELGLGVCEMMLRPVGKINTFVVKTFEVG